MPPPSKPSLVVPRHCAAMTVALEVVAEHRRLRNEEDARTCEEATDGDARKRRKRARPEPER